MASFYVEFRHEIKDGYVYIYIYNFGMDFEDDDPWDGPYYNYLGSAACCKIIYRISEADYGLFKQKAFKYIGLEYREVGVRELNEILSPHYCHGMPWAIFEHMTVPYGIKSEAVESIDLSREELDRDRREYEMRLTEAYGPAPAPKEEQ